LGNDDRPGYERHQRPEKLLGICRPSLLEQWRNHSFHFGKMPGNLGPDLRLVSLRAELGQRLVPTSQPSRPSWWLRHSATLPGHTLNLKRVLNGEEEEQFALKPSDIIYVPEKFNWF
jgi:hypothetical protein